MNYNPNSKSFGLALSHEMSYSESPGDLLLPVQAMAIQLT
jgi:hypothetical protein